MTDPTPLMHAWLEAVASGPAEAFLRTAADDVVTRLPFAPPGVANTLHGADAALAALATVWAAKESFAWLDVTVRRTEDPELLVTTARSEVVLRGGRRYTNSYVMLTRVRAGRVVEHDEYFNPLPVIAAYGAGVADG